MKINKYSSRVFVDPINPDENTKLKRKTTYQYQNFKKIEGKKDTNKSLLKRSGTIELAIK